MFMSMNTHWVTYSQVLKVGLLIQILDKDGGVDPWNLTVIMDGASVDYVDHYGTLV